MDIFTIIKVESLIDGRTRYFFCKRPMFSSEQEVCIVKPTTSDLHRQAQKKKRKCGGGNTLV